MSRSSRQLVAGRLLVEDALVLGREALPHGFGHVSPASPASASAAWNAFCVVRSATVASKAALVVAVRRPLGCVPSQERAHHESKRRPARVLRVRVGGGHRSSHPPRSVLSLALTESTVPNIACSRSRCRDGRHSRCARPQPLQRPGRRDPLRMRGTVRRFPHRVGRRPCRLMLDPRGSGGLSAMSRAHRPGRFECDPAPSVEVQSASSSSTTRPPSNARSYCPMRSCADGPGTAERYVEIDDSFLKLRKAGRRVGAETPAPPAGGTPA